MEFIEKILDKCVNAGADSAEVFRVNRKVMSLTVRDGQVETIEKSTPGGLAIRYYKNNKTAFAHTTDLSEKSIEGMILKTKNMADKTEPDEFAILPGPGQYGRDLDIYSDTRANVAVDEKIAYLANLEKSGMDYDVLVDKSNGAWCREVLSELELVNSNGEGSVSARHFDDLMSAEDIADKYVSRALRLVGGTTVSGGDYEIIFTPTAATSILWGLRYALNGEDALKGASLPAKN
jgi:PmbA protein